MAEQPNMIYLDYAASTPVDASVAEAMTALMTVAGNYANPSSTHAAGRRSVEYIAHAAQQLAELLNTDADRLIWTSGARPAPDLHAHRAQGGYRSVECT